ncbi:MAG: hypothetical protein JNL72_04885, partial [Flavipsychrobacter sp.]|nr:hypothetical protein [Flavipsychrobacter sp.]
MVASYSSDYSAPFIDESVSADSFVYGGASDAHFSGGRTVYWKVISTRGEAQGVFNTPDYSASFAGVYAVEVKKYNYEFGQYTLVGTYTDSLSIVDLAGDSIQVINPVINTPNKGQYLKNCSTEEKAGYLGVWGNNTTTVNYLIAQDILSVSHYTGGLGHG